ncbi:MAG: MXAN_5187 C-terminal domain-containing protein [Thermoanaerobaculia bacterium]|nr:MXAN_5187 C-terminal domain-containing protein [Thermoanaerobaculia bacterium]
MKDIDQLEEQVKTLRIEFERFFNGDLDIPPSDLQESIRRRIADLRTQRKSNVDNFRLTGLEARFSAYSEMFMRRMRNQERQGGRRSAAPARTVDVAEGIVFGDTVDPELVKPLYRSLYQDGSRKTVDPDAFAAYLARQHQLIRDKSGCRQVRFRVVEEDGKPKLKAKPVREDA